MDAFHLDKSIHALMTDSENKIMIENNQLVILDTIKKTIFGIPITPDDYTRPIITFFNITSVELVKAGFLDPSLSTCIPSQSATSTSTFAAESPILENSLVESNTLGNNIPSKNSSQGPASWKDSAAVKALIAQWKEKNDLGVFQSSTIRNDMVWKMIADSLATQNVKWRYTAQQCKDKFKEIRKQYVKTKDHNRQSGNSPATCKFYEELDEIFGDKPCVAPCSIASSSTCRKRIASPGFNDENPDDPLSCDNQNSSPKSSTQKKSRVQKELEAWASILRTDAEKREDAREKRHQESLQIFSSVMNKLIDKLQ